MTFDDRLRQAIERGHKRSETLAREAAAKAREGRVRSARDAKKRAEDAATAGAVV